LESLFAPFSVEIRIDEPLCTHTTIDVGGPCHCFLLPESMDALTASIRICKEEKIPYRLLGAGSNILFADSGYSGVIIATERLVGSTINHSLPCSRPSRKQGSDPSGSSREFPAPWGEQSQ
jgi:hypothetical protein